MSLSTPASPADKLSALRQQLAASEVDAFLLPVNDAFQSEYPPASAKRLQWLTGFSGSAGMVAVAAEKAAFFTDGRYTIQAAQETDVALYEQHNSGDLRPEAWLAEQLSSKAVIGYDPWLFTASDLKRFEAAVKAKQIALKPLAVNPVDALWADRPADPATAPFEQGIEYAGRSWQEKRDALCKELKEQQRDAALLTLPDGINWLLNIRGDDIPFNPLVLCYALLHADGHIEVFATARDWSKAPHLGEEVERLPLELLPESLRALKGKKVQLDPSASAVWFAQFLQEIGEEIIEASDPCLLPKACKHEVEQQGTRQAHIRDGVAIAKFLHWLDVQAEKGLSEIEADEILLQFREEGELFRGPSFPSITGSGPHGAIVHYRVSEQSNRQWQKGEIFLIDSGGQYRDGTTDITRTVIYGQPTEEMRDRFTRVLKGHIAIAMAQFPEGTNGEQLDTLARHALWQAGLDYDHGTGHGVGSYLCVHEGPQRISKRGGGQQLKPGMILSNEPGYYKSGEYGIRIENLVLVVEKGQAESGKRLLGFDNLTMAPIDKRLIDVSMLAAEEIDWLNDYHQQVWKALEGQVSGEVRGWLQEACKPL